MSETQAELLATVAEQLISHRVMLGLEIEEAAAEAKVAPERLAAAEEAKLPLDEQELGRLADAYGIDVTAFFGGQTTPVSYLFGA